MKIEEQYKEDYYDLMDRLGTLDKDEIERLGYYYRGDEAVNFICNGEYYLQKALEDLDEDYVSEKRENFISDAYSVITSNRTDLDIAKLIIRANEEDSIFQDKNESFHWNIGHNFLYSNINGLKEYYHQYGLDDGLNKYINDCENTYLIHKLNGIKTYIEEQEAIRIEKEELRTVINNEPERKTKTRLVL